MVAGVGGSGCHCESGAGRSGERRAAGFERRAANDTFWSLPGSASSCCWRLSSRECQSRDAVLAKIAESYPVAAADYIRTNNLPGPLFNSFPWGGFLTWYLPEYPVAIDGRADLYGPDFNVHYAKVMNFEEHYSTFSPLNEARVILLENNSHMAVALASVPGYKTAYSDNVAVVLVRDQSQP